MMAGKPKANLDRDSIVLAGLELAAAQGFRNFNVRALAARLGCSPMALYRYIDNKDDLLRDMADRAIADIELPDDHSSWIDWYVTVTLRSWTIMQRFPGLAAYVLDQGPVLATPSSLSITTRMFEVLLDAGFDSATAALVWRTAHCYLSGYVMLTHGHSKTTPPDHTTGQSVAAVFAVLADKPNDQSMATGLRRLLNGFTV
jgi:AcrR family transcriptional regulator